MSTTALTQVTDQATAHAALAKTRDDMARAESRARKATAALHALIVEVRPTGLLPVEQMATAIGRDRNYIDSVWSDHGGTTEGRQTRPQASVDEGASLSMLVSLADASHEQRTAAAALKTARAERNRVVALVYASKILGPSAIAAVAGIDRNHVLRTARRAGVAPQHRPGTSNQYTVRKGA